jgi:hypothetical protein
MLSLREWFGSEEETSVAVRPTVRLKCEQLDERLNPTRWIEFSFGLSNGMSGVGAVEINPQDLMYTEYEALEIWDLQIRFTNLQGMDISTVDGTVDFSYGVFQGMTLEGTIFTMGSSNVFQFGTINWSDIVMYDQSWNEITGNINYDSAWTQDPPAWIFQPYPPNP